ncbi:MAG TPA: YggS family pyridoxal phosphate-dependent enzyme [Terriglobales bacterium]|jgi:hypothetical protein
MDQAAPVREAYERIREAMLSACARRRRAPESVRLLAASKTVAPERIREAYACGCRLFGENRVQERQAKLQALRGLTEASWHLLGPLQQNKAARALHTFDCIESLDSLALAERLSRLAAQPIPVLIEVNIGREPQKHGVLPEAALELGLAIHAMDRLVVTGVMAVPPATASPEAARPYFAELAALGERLRQALRHPPAGWELSMGMSQDYEVAIEEGATLVRLGTALFGARGLGAR